MKIDDSVIHVLSAMMRQSPGATVQAKALPGNPLPAQGEVSSESMVSLGKLFEASLLNSLETLIAQLEEFSSNTAAALRGYAQVFHSTLSDLAAQQEYSPVQLKGEVQVLRGLSFLRGEMVSFLNSLSSGEASGPAAKIISGIVERLSVYESYQQVYSQQGFYIFPLIDRNHPDRDIEVAFFQERKGKDARRGGQFSFMLSFDTQYIGKITLWAGVESRSIRVSARVASEETRHRLYSAVDSLKERLSEVSYDLEKMDVTLKGGPGPDSGGDHVEFIA